MHPPMAKKNNHSLTEKVPPSQALSFMPRRHRAVMEKVNPLPASGSANRAALTTAVHGSQILRTISSGHFFPQLN